MDHIVRFIRQDYRKLLVFFVLFWTPVIIFFKIAGEIIEREPIEGDVSILNWLHSQATPWLDQFFLAATNLGGIVGMATILLILAAWFISRRQFRSASFLIFSVGGAAVANLILKLLFHRDRPSLFQSQIVETSFSFPSGHAMVSSALIMCLAIMAWKTRWRWPVIIIGSLLVLAIGTSRAYFGVHYVSDIVAGWCASVAWVLIVYYLISRFSTRQESKTKK